MRISDWSSDVCSSDLVLQRQHPGRLEAAARPFRNLVQRTDLGELEAEPGEDAGPHGLAADEVPVGEGQRREALRPAGQPQQETAANRFPPATVRAPTGPAASPEGGRVGEECVSTWRTRGVGY